MKISGLSLPIALLLLLITACPVPIDEIAVREMTDETAPAVAIQSPLDASDYTQTVTVTGKVADEGEIRSLTYQVIGTLGVLLSGSVPSGDITSAGDFSFQFSTVSFDGPLVITVTAEDWNDNTGSAAINLSDPGSPVSSLTAAPSSKTIELAWDAVEGASDYTIYYTTNGTIPSETYGENVTVADTTYLLEDLENGNLHIFLLRANLTAGGSYWSSYVYAIPLSSQTLAPLVTAGYGEIHLEWDSIEGSDSFQILRATDPEGPFTTYTGIIEGTDYTDTGVSEGTWYYYKVRPEREDSLESFANGACTIQYPPSPESGITSLTTPGSANKLEYPSWEGDYVYTAAGSSGLLVIDVSRPHAPEIAASLATTDARDLVLYDYGGGVHYAFIADGTGKVRAVDVSDPLNPVLAGTLPDSLGEATAITAAAGREVLFVIDGTGDTAIQAIDVSTPSSPVRIGAPYSGGSTYDFKDLASDLAPGLDDYPFLYVTNANTDEVHLLEMYAYIPPANSTVTWYVYRTYEDTDLNGFFADLVTVDDDYVYILGRAKSYLEPPPPYALYVMSKYPATFSRVGITGTSNGFISDLCVRGDRVYAADGLGLQIIDVSNPASPELTDFWNTPGASSGVATDGTTCYVASGTLGFQTVDISLPDSPTLEGQYDPGYGYNGLAIGEDTAYMTSSSGLELIDISNPASPNPVSGGSLALSGAGSLVISGPYAYITRGSSGLAIVDISESSAPVSVGSVDPISGSVGRLAVRGDYAYLAGSTGLQIYDISDPSNPFGVGFFDRDGVSSMNDVVLSGETAYVAQGSYFQPNNLTVLDISDPYQPVLTGKVSSGMTLSSLSLCGDYAYIGDGFGGGGAGVYTVDINPSHSDYLTSNGPFTPDSSWYGVINDVTAFGEYLYMVGPTDGLLLAHISDPDNIAEGEFSFALDWTGSSPNRIMLSGGHALIADGAEGLVIADLF